MPKESAERQRFLVDGGFKCTMHKTPMIFLKRYHLKRHLYFVHRNGGEEMLGLHGFQNQLIETPRYECKGTKTEYCWARKDFERYLNQYEAETNQMQLFLELNIHYEQKWILEQTWRGSRLVDDYKKSLQPETEKDDDTFNEKCLQARKIISTRLSLIGEIHILCFLTT